MLRKPFPWKCGNCGKTAVVESVVPYSVSCLLDGRRYQVELAEMKAPRCSECGEIVMVDSANEQVSTRLREMAGLLSPEQIRTNREALGMTQTELAARLGVLPCVYERLESGGQLQDLAVDRLLRLYFQSSSVRGLLAEDANIPLLGVQTQNASAIV